MNSIELVKALRRNMVETGSLVCWGCGYEHSCGLRGCAIMREAADTLERQAANLDAYDVLEEENEFLRTENTRLKLALVVSCVPFEELLLEDGEK